MEGVRVVTEIKSGEWCLKRGMERGENESEGEIEVEREQEREKGSENERGEVAGKVRMMREDVM